MADKKAGGLYLSIGLTLSQLQSDFLAAEQTVKQGIAALNRQQNLIKLRMEADTAGLDRAKDATKILEIQEQSLTQVLQMQRDKLTLATKAYQDVAQSKGANSAAAKQLETSMERERLAVARLEAQLKSLSAQKIAIDSTKLQTQLQENISRLNAKIQNVKIQAELDTSKFKSAGSVFDAQKVQIAAVTKEIELQRQKLAQLQAQMYQSARQTGADSSTTLNVKSNVLQQIQEINRLQTRLKELQSTNINVQIRADSLKRVEADITENIARINAKIEHIKVKTDIDVSRLGTAASEFDKAKAHVQGLNRELDLQNQKLAEMKRALGNSISTNGLNNVKTINLQTEIQRQIQAVDQLKAKIQELNKIAPPKSNSLLSGYHSLKGNVTGKIGELSGALTTLQGATTSADSAITSMLSVIGSIPTPVGLAVAALVGVPLIFKGIENSIIDMTRAAAASGDAVYVMSRGMQMSVADAGKFSTNAKVAGAQVNDLAMAVKNVQRQVARGGEDSRAAEWLKRYGESAYDASGNLKDLNQMTFALSNALKKAQEDGKGAEFVLNVFRNVSADAITAIEDWADVNEQASRIVKAGLANPKLAHEVKGNLNAMNVQSAQLGTSFTNALLPVANEIVPRLTERMGKMTQIIADNKEVILDFGRDFAQVWGNVEDAIDTVAEGFDELGKLARQNRVVRQSDTKSVVEKYKDDATVKNAHDILEREIADDGYTDEDIQRLRARNDLYRKEIERTEQVSKALWQKRREEFAEANKPILDKYLHDDSIKTATDLLNKLTDAEKEAVKQADAPFFDSLLERCGALFLELPRLRAEAEATKKAFLDTLNESNKIEGLRGVKGDTSPDLSADARKAYEDAGKKYRDLSDELYKITHNDYDNRKFELDKWHAEMVNGVELTEKEREVIEKLYAAKSAQIEQERADKLKQIRDRVEAADKTALQNKLDDIEKEKNSWIKAGMDEAEAEKLAQKQLSDYLKNTRAELTEKITALHQTELENRLSQIEKEKQAWIDKCGEEVKATQLAEQQKADAQRNAAMQVIKQQLEAYKAYQEGGFAGLQAYKMAELQKSGVDLKYLNMTPQQLMDFQRANQVAEKALLPNFMTATDRAQYQQQRESDLQRAREYDSENYAIVNGIKVGLSEALGGTPVKLTLDDGSRLDVSGFQKATITDKEGNVQRFELPNVVGEVPQSFLEMPTALQSAMDSLRELPTVVQGISENLAEVSIPNFEEITTPFANMDKDLEVTIQQFNSMGSQVEEVTVKLSDLNAALEKFSLPANSLQKQETRTPVDVNVTVQIEEAHAWDSQHIQELADKVADKIKPEIVNAVGGDSNSY